MIVTFYSFKGGVGRSFTLVETAVQLAALGRSVVVWDLDLEAPGVQSIPDLHPLDDALTTGTLDLIREFVDSGYTFPDKSLAEALLPFELPTALAAAGGKLSFLLPGKLDGGYAGRYAEIDWATLFDPKTKVGPAFFYKIAHSLVHELGYEILLIDSRTGYTDLGAVCTIQIPDLVVLVSNLNEQNLAGLEQVHAAVTRTPARQSGRLPVFVLVNMVPDAPEDLREQKIATLRAKGLGPHQIVPLHPELLLTDRVPTLAGHANVAADFAPVAEQIEFRRQELEARTERAIREELSRAKGKGDPEELEALRRRGIYEKAKTFEERVAELFSLLGYRTTVDYKRDDMQFDVRLELSLGVIPIHALVECKDTDRPVTQQQVREFASKVEYAADADKLPYQAILIARSGFANNAHEVAKNLRVHLQTYDQLLLSLVDLRPNLDAAVRAFQGTALERLYVEQEVVFDAGIRPGKEVEPKSLTREVLRWLKEPSGTFLTLLGDFGCGKTSFSKRLACELALQARAELSEGKGGTRAPVLIDLREGGSTTVTLESLLTQHFQRLSSQPFNPQALLQLNREGYLVLIFDGFDETIAYTEPGRYLENLRQILRAAEGKAKVLMTCRTHYFRDRPEALRRLGKAPAVVSTQGATRLYEEIQDRPGSDIGYLMEFREGQISEYLRKALPPPSDWQAFREQIRQTYNLEDLAERPFLLEIIVKTLPRLLQRQGEVTLADLYESYCESWFAHTDFRLTLTRDFKVALVEYLARLIWDSPENRVHYDLLFEKAAEFFKDRPLTVYDRERVDYEVRTALFLHRDAEGYYSFIHRSFLEFFIARTIRAGLAAGDPGCLALRRITREVAFFLEFWPEAKRIPDLAGKVLSASYQAGVSENALLLLYFHALATLGPLVRPETEKEPDLGKIREIFAKMRPAALNLAGADLEGAALPGIDLHAARLEGASLVRADLRQASIEGARLERADLRFVDFRRGIADGADLSGADLGHLDGQDASFRKAVLRHADLSFATLTRADLRNADLKEAETVGTGLFNAQGTTRASLAVTAGLPKLRDLDLRWLIGHDGPVNSVAWSPDGRCLATGSDDGTVMLWDSASGGMLHPLEEHSNSVLTVAWSPDGQRLASGSSDKTVKIWDAASGRVIHSLEGHGSLVYSVAWSPEGQRLASGSSDKTVKIWDAASGRAIHSLEEHGDLVLTVAWSPDGQRLASGSNDNTVKIWDMASGRAINSLEGHGNSIYSVAWSPDGQRLASGSDDNTVKIWDAASGRAIHSLEGHGNLVLTVAWSPDGQRLASGSDDQTVKIWDAASGRVIHSLEGHGDWVRSVAWSPDGQRLASSSDDQMVKIWDAASGQEINSLAEHGDWVRSVAWSPDGQQLASGSDDKTVKIWDAASGRAISSLEGHGHWVNSVAWSPDGQRLASGSDDKTVKIWDAASGQAIHSLEGHGNWVNSVAWSPDGQRLASGSSDNTVKIWDAVSGRAISSLEGHGHWVNSVAWSPDGQRLAAGSDGKTVKIWDAVSGRVISSLEGHGYSVDSVAWSPDGQRLAASSDDKTVKIWDAASGRALNSLEGHGSSVFSVAWSPDGQRLAADSSDKTVRLWDAESGEVLHLLAPMARVRSLTWSPDGRRLAVASDWGFVEIWDLEADPPCPLVRLYHTSSGFGFAATPDGYVFGSPEALEFVRFGDRWALYDVTDVPERVSAERVAAALSPHPLSPSPIALPPGRERGDAIRGGLPEEGNGRSGRVRRKREPDSRTSK
jgi:WD40 repeat protein